MYSRTTKYVPIRISQDELAVKMSWTCKFMQLTMSSLGHTSQKNECLFILVHILVAAP